MYVRNGEPLKEWATRKREGRENRKIKGLKTEMRGRNTDGKTGRLKD